MADRHDVISAVDPPTRIRPVVSRSVTLAPTTVTLCVPVDWPFVRIKELITGDVYVTCDVKLPACSPDVTLNGRDTPVPTAVLHNTLLSDRHIVDEPPLPPTRNIALEDQRPAPLRPTTVTLIDPVIAAFVVTTLLDDTPSIVTAEAKLPTNVDVVDVNCRFHNRPDEPLSCRLLLDCQAVDTAPLPPSRDDTLYRQCPEPEPTIVTLIAPVDAVFAGFKLLTAGPSIVTTVSSDPDDTPTVPATE